MEKNFEYNEDLDINDDYEEDSNQDYNLNRQTKLGNIIEMETIEPNLMYFCKNYQRAIALIKQCHDNLVKKNIPELSISNGIASTTQPAVQDLLKVMSGKSKLWPRNMDATSNNYLSAYFTSSIGSCC